MSDSFFAMQNALRSTGLYSVESGSRLFAELMAYDAGFDLLRRNLQTLLTELFASTADSFGLLRKEQLYQVNFSGCDNSLRREMLCALGAVDTHCLSLWDLENALCANGIVAQIVPQDDSQTVAVLVSQVRGMADSEEVARRIERILPAHLLCTVSFVHQI